MKSLQGDRQAAPNFPVPTPSFKKILCREKKRETLLFDIVLKSYIMSVFLSIFVAFLKTHFYFLSTFDNSSIHAPNLNFLISSLICWAHPVIEYNSYSGWHKLYKADKDFFLLSKGGLPQKVWGCLQSSVLSIPDICNFSPHKQCEVQHLHFHQNVWIFHSLILNRGG